MGWESLSFAISACYRRAAKGFRFACACWLCGACVHVLACKTRTAQRTLSSTSVFLACMKPYAIYATLCCIYPVVSGKACNRLLLVACFRTLRLCFYFTVQAMQQSLCMLRSKLLKHEKLVLLSGLLCSCFRATFEFWLLCATLECCSLLHALQPVHSNRI